MYTYRVGPGVPGSGDGSTSSNGSVVEETVGGILVADDVGGGVRIRGDVAVVRGGLGPGDELVTGVGTGSNSPHLVETGVGLAADGPRGDVAVGVDEAGTGGQGQENGVLHVGRHFWKGFVGLEVRNLEEYLVLKLFVCGIPACGKNDCSQYSERKNEARRMFKKKNEGSEYLDLRAKEKRRRRRDM